MKWNGIINFYFSVYLVLGMVGWISVRDIRIDKDKTHTERFSTLFGLSLAAFTILYPIILGIIYKRKQNDNNFRDKYGALVS